MNYEYELLLAKVMSFGKDKSDRTGTGTRSIFGAQMRFNLADGFPLITTKKVFTKAIIHELLWFLRGETNVRSLQAAGVTIWDEWRRPYTLDRELVVVEKREGGLSPYTGDFSLRGLDISRESIEFKLGDTWKRMMRRCYDPTHEKYQFYGAKGVSVCERWHDPALFIADAQMLPHWFYKQKDWSRFHLDKDYYGASAYGPETSVWLREDENAKYTSTAMPLQVVTLNGTRMAFLCAAEAARQLGLSTSSLNRFVGAGPLTGLKGANKVLSGWVFEPLPDEDAALLRLKLIDDGDLGPIYSKQWRSWSAPDGNVIDQISDVVRTLKTNPDSRRHIVSAWNPADVDDQALPPCHCLFQFYVVDGKLSCQLYQRSADLFLGVPFNIASYALLTHMIAQQCDLGVGDFIWTGGDCHIYSNHFEQVKLQLQRTPYPFPALRLNRRPPSIFDYVYGDFLILDYQHHPAIKADVAV